MWISKTYLCYLAAAVWVILTFIAHDQMLHLGGLRSSRAYTSSSDDRGIHMDKDYHSTLAPLTDGVSDTDDNKANVVKEGCNRNQGLISTPEDVSGTPPLVTVCIPVFEGSLTLEETVRSVSNQTYSNIELLISFDPCADTDLCKDFVAKLEKHLRETGQQNIHITTFSHEAHLGWISNVNFLLLQAQGAFVSILPDDDTIPSNYYEELAACLTANPAAINCFPYVVCKGVSDRQEEKRRAKLPSTSAASTSAYQVSCQEIHQKSIRGSREDRIYAAVKHHKGVSFRGLVRNGQHQQLPGWTADGLSIGNNMRDFLLQPTHNDYYVADITQIMQHAVAGDLIAVDVPYFKLFQPNQIHRFQINSMSAEDKMQAWVDHFANIYNVAHLYTSSSQNFYQACTDNLLTTLPRVAGISATPEPEKILAIFRHKISEAKSNKKRVAVLGGGIQGCTMALLFEKHGYDVTIFDKSTDILNRASSNQEGKIHLGLVYSGDQTLKTGARMLESALRFSGYLEYLVGETIDWAKWKSSKFHYMVPYDSILSPTELELYFNNLQAIYYEMLKGDPTLSYLGERPQRLYRPIPLNKTLVNESFFEAAFESEEYAISHSELKLAIKRALRSKHTIHTLLNTIVLETRREVGNFSALDRNTTFQIVTNLGVHGGFDKVVNCLWEGRREIDQQMGIPAWSGNNVRLKFGIKTEYMEPLATMPSMTIVNGPFGDFVNYPGDQKMYFSWYPVSMHGMVVDEKIPAELHDIADGAIPRELASFQIDSHQQSFDAMLLPQGPALDFKCPELVGGFILGNGKSDIQNRDSLLHTRCDEPIYHEDGYFSISTQKFTSAPYHAYLLEKRFLSRNGKENR